MAKSKMTICKDCGAEVSTSAKTCPKCGAKLKKAHPARAIIGILIIIIGLAMIANSGSNNNTTTNTSNSSVTTTNSYMTMDKFNQIQTGMTYQQVVDIVGKEGTLSTESSYGSASMQVYYWYAQNGISNATVTFNNGKVSAKSQLGLE